MKPLKVLCILFCLILTITITSCKKEDQIMENYPGITDNKHIIKELSLEELSKKVSNKETFVVVLGFPECPWCQALMPESHLTSGTSKGSFTRLLQLKKFADIPVSTQEKARESRPHPEDPRFRLLAREEGSFPCVVGKEFPEFPSHLKRRHSPQERRE